MQSFNTDYKNMRKKKSSRIRPAKNTPWETASKCIHLRFHKCPPATVTNVSAATNQCSGLGHTSSETQAPQSYSQDSDLTTDRIKPETDQWLWN